MITKSLHEEMCMLNQLVRSDVPLELISATLSDHFESLFGRTIEEHKKHRWICPVTFQPITKPLIQMNLAPQYKVLRNRVLLSLGWNVNHISFSDTIVVRVDETDIFYVLAVNRKGVTKRVRFIFGKFSSIEENTQPVKYPLHQNILGLIMGF